MSLEEVQQELQDAEENLANLKMQLRMNQLDNPLSVRYARRDVARLRTVLREHELGTRLLTAAPDAEEPSGSAPVVEPSEE